MSSATIQRAKSNACQFDCSTFQRHLVNSVLSPIIGLLLLGNFSPLTGYAQDNQETEWQELFDGKTLTGWDGPEGLWRVEDGCIVGQSQADQPIPHNLFLIWRGGELADFELRLEYWIDSGNSGVQFRSRETGKHRIAGYQSDLEAGENYTGIIYEEGGRGILCQRGKKTVLAVDGKKTESELEFDGKIFLDKVKPGQWNEYVIRAEGNRITQSINGVAVAELVDDQTEKMAASGLLALQLHAGPPMVVKFKNIRLKKLKP